MNFTTFVDLPTPITQATPSGFAHLVTRDIYELQPREDGKSCLVWYRNGDSAAYHPVLLSVSQVQSAIIAAEWNNYRRFNS